MSMSGITHQSYTTKSSPTASGSFPSMSTPPSSSSDYRQTRLPTEIHSCFGMSPVALIQEIGRLTHECYRLQVLCERNKNAPKGTNIYINELVKSGDLVWAPEGEQNAVFADAIPGPTNKDIVLAKLRPGQEVDMELHAIKGVGKDHAKWSPVATASYRLHPLVLLNPSRPVPSHLADKFAKCFSPGVVQVDRNGKVSIDERNLRMESMSREVLRHKEFEGCVELKRIRDWFIFNVESEGPYAPERLLPEAIAVMREKIASIRMAAEALLADADGLGGPGVGTVGADGDVEMGGI
ncbi:hypothetical protein AcV7_009294 [Taiwanofungus camphoratus]|nr:hypothetical protein AcV7_009294 [Antrodia cinnamomea]